MTALCWPALQCPGLLMLLERVQRTNVQPVILHAEGRTYWRTLVWQISLWFFFISSFLIHSVVPKHNSTSSICLSVMSHYELGSCSQTSVGSCEHVHLGKTTTSVHCSRLPALVVTWFLALTWCSFLQTSAGSLNALEGIVTNCYDSSAGWRI